MSAPAPFQPIDPGERIVRLDALRGLALCGILVMNMEAFNGPLLVSTSGLDPSLTGADRIADALVYIFVQGKFFTLFSLLFGMGFAVMAQRAEAAGRPFAGLYWRRGLALLGIGLVHGLLVWSGDILTLYALLSFFLMAFRTVPARWLAWVGALACLAAPAMLLALGLLAWLMSLSPESAAGWDAALAEQGAQVQALVQRAQEVYPGGHYGEAVALRARELGIALSALPMSGPLVLGMFLLGAALLRSGAIVAPERHGALFAWLRWGALPLGLAAMLASCAIAPTLPMDRLDLPVSAAQALMLAAGVLMCLGYVAWLLRLFGTRPGARLAAWLAPAGRMALSNYLLQSLVCTLVFYGYGLGYFGQMPRAWHAPFAVALFALQVPASRLWLSRFRYGPAEWLWRSLTYLRAQPMRLRVTPAVNSMSR